MADAQTPNPDPDDDEEPTRPEPNPDDVRTLDYHGRKIRVLRPTAGQVAAMAQLGRSGLMGDLQRVANLLDLLHALLADEKDQEWLSRGMLSGLMEFAGEDDVPSALGLLYEVAKAFRPEGDNRTERRKAAKARRVQ